LLVGGVCIPVYSEGNEWISKNTLNTGPENNLAQLASATFWRRLLKLKRLFLNGHFTILHAFIDLSPLSGLANLQQLYVSDTPVTDLSPLLDLIKNNLPVRWSTDFDGIYVEN
jgi:hypothetical protein